MIAVLVVVGAAGGRLIRLPGAGLLGPLALTVALQLSGLSFGLTVPNVLVQIGYMVIGWQAGVAFTRDSLRAVGRMLPAAIALIVAARRRDRGLRRACWPIRGQDPARGLPRHQPGRGVRRAGDRGGDRIRRHVHHRRAGGPRPADAVHGAAAGPHRDRLTERHAGRQSREITEAEQEPVRVAD